MNDDRPGGDETLRLWREAARRLRLVDREPAFSMDQVDALLARLGPRREGEDLHQWLDRGRAGAAARPDDAATSSGAQIIPFDPRRQRFRPVAEVTRLAADTAGAVPGLPERELETADGRFRLAISLEEREIVIQLTTLGAAADAFAGSLVGLAPARTDEPPVALIRLDEDGDGTARLADTTALRRALLRPVLGLIEDIETS
jgi:hypothetical protein